MGYIIHFWHGVSQASVKRIEPFCVEKDGNWFFEGTLDEFNAQYGRLFLVLPEYNMIAITQFSNFNQR
jgi:hypothetical protein